MSSTPVIISFQKIGVLNDPIPVLITNVYRQYNLVNNLTLKRLIMFRDEFISANPTSEQEGEGEGDEEETG